MAWRDSVEADDAPAEELRKACEAFDHLFIAGKLLVAPPGEKGIQTEGLTRSFVRHIRFESAFAMTRARRAGIVCLQPFRST